MPAITIRNGKLIIFSFQWVQVGHLFVELGVEDKAYDVQWFKGLAFSEREKRLVQYMVKDHRFESGTPLVTRAWKVASRLTPKNIGKEEKDERNLGGSVAENLAGLHTTLRMYTVSH